MKKITAHSQMLLNDNHLQMTTLWRPLGLHIILAVNYLLITNILSITNIPN